MYEKITEEKIAQLCSAIGGRSLEIRYGRIEIAVMALRDVAKLASILEKEANDLLCTGPYVSL